MVWRLMMMRMLDTGLVWCVVVVAVCGVVA